MCGKLECNNKPVIQINVLRPLLKVLHCILLALFIALCAWQPLANAAACRQELFADAVQANQTGGGVHFDSDARVLFNPDNTLNASIVSMHSYSNFATCGEANCLASAAPSPSQQLQQFRLTDSNIDHTTPWSATSYIGSGGQREYRLVNAEGGTTVNIDDGASYNSDHYIIDTINLGYKSTLNLRPGNYWVRELNMESESSINVVGAGAVHLYIYNNVIPGWLARFNVTAYSEAQPSEQLVIVPYGGAQFNANLVSAYIYSPAAINIGPQSDFYGAVSGGSVTLKNGAKVSYFAPGATANLGQLCAGDLAPDADGDSVPDSIDNCDETPATESAGSTGCSASQLDADRDGVSDDLDQCVGTLEDALVDDIGCSMGELPNCREQIFSDGVQTYSSSGVIQFGYNASIRDNSDTTLNTTLTRYQHGSMVNTCGSVHCVSGGSPAKGHQLKPYQVTADLNGYYIPYYSFGEIGSGGRRHYGDIDAASYATLSADVFGHNEDQDYYIKSLMLGYKSQWNVLPGTYWVEKLSVGYGAAINVIGDGVVRIYTRETVSLGGANLINYNSDGPQKPNQFILVSYDGIFTGDGQFAGYIFAAGGVSLGYQFGLYGAIYGANLVTNSESTVYFEAPNERTDLGQICANDILDSDNDDVLDRYDTCPETGAGQAIDSSGCAQYQLDSDGDGLNNQVELDDGTDPFSADSDDDGVSDSVEKADATNPLIADTDRDGVSDGVEKADGTDPLNTDSDDDTLSDSVEKSLGTDPLSMDSDEDGVRDDIEAAGATSPLNPDTDGDGVNDNNDVFPVDASEAADSDADSIGDNADNCPLTPAGATVDGNGCAATQLDTDNDNVNNAIDACPVTPVAEQGDVNDAGCGASERDTDSDGVNDNIDAYPLDPSETADTDTDGIGDNADSCPLTPAGAEIDGNGCAATQLDTDNDSVNNAIDTCPVTPVAEQGEVNAAGCGASERDTDSDGVNDNIDAFPLDPSETADLDGDGIGDNADDDRDGDGVLNTQDAFPSDSAESSDLDLDGIGDNADTDRDGDGIANDVDACPSQILVPEAVGPNGCELVANVDTDGDGVLDADDAFPADPTEWTDLDNDGTGDNSDVDVDGDGVDNSEDRFPRNAAESSDIDNDGIGDNSDTDRDNDGVDNALDLFPNDASETTDLDGDGVGDNSDPDRDGDGVLNDSDAYPSDPARTKLPIVTIDTPKTLVTVGYSPITVSGTVGEGATAFTVNGVPVQQNSGAWSVDVALQEGHNTIVARMVDPSGITSTASINVSLDLTPPYMTIESHKHEQVVYTPVIAVTGLINDIVRGTIEDEQVQVTVNDLHAIVKNRSYLVNNVLLVEGENELSVVGVDQAGNAAVNTILVTYVAPQGKTLEVVAGQNQTGTTFKDLSAQLVVKVLDDDGAAVVDKNVVFRVTQGSGGVKALLDDPVNRAVLAKTDANGLARTYFQLGQRAGIGNHKVTAKVVGYKTQAVFHATAQGTVGNKLSINTGNNQRGGTFQPLPSPFVVAVTDLGANVVAGARVKFETRRGGGLFENGESEIITITDSDGRASAHLTLGGLEGLDRQVVRATLLDAPPADITNPFGPVIKVTAGFTSTGFTPKAPGLTTISGVVMNNQDQPLPGVTILVDGTTRQAVADSQGQFTITEAPVGPVHLIADGSTTTVEGEYPALAYNIVTVSGVDNPLSAPIYMVKLNTANAVMAGGEDDAVLTLPEVPGFKLEVPAHSVTFPDGSREGLVSVTVVNSSKVPMAPPNGMQPQFIVTIQPTGAMFDPPARLSLPNVDGQAPGAQVEMYSFDHDLEEFVAIGLGTVNESGTTITSNLGVGVIKAGWHCGSTPGGSGTGHDCGDCAECEGEFCVNNPDDPVANKLPDVKTIGPKYVSSSLMDELSADTLGLNQADYKFGNAICKDVCEGGKKKYRLTSSGVTASQEITIATSLFAAPKDSNSICVAEEVAVSAALRTEVLKHEEMHSEPYKELYKKYREKFRSYGTSFECKEAYFSVSLDFPNELQIVNQNEQSHCRFKGMPEYILRCGGTGKWEIIPSTYDSDSVCNEI